MAILQRGGTTTATPTPELSILVSCYNQAEILENALREAFRTVGSVVPSFETIIINDGSNDGSVRILDRIRKEFPHIRVTHQLHSGHAKAVRRGYDLARGDYVFQIDLKEPEWVSDFPKFWEMRERYALVTGFHPNRGGRARRALRWLQAKWIKLWFGAELIEPDASFRLCRREIGIGYLSQVPRDYEGVNLAMTLVAFKESPRLLLEVEIGATTAGPKGSFSELLVKFSHYFTEILWLRWRRPKLTPLTATAQIA